MDKVIDAHFERLEKALSSLIDSVTKYHPSTVQAEELSAADIELSKGLEQGQNTMSRFAQMSSYLTQPNSPSSPEQPSTNPGPAQVVRHSRRSDSRDLDYTRSNA